MPNNETFARKRDANRTIFKGWSPNNPPDSLPPDKYPYAQNVRVVNDDSIETRPGQVLSFATGGVPVTDMRSYVELETDGLPRTLGRDTNDAIWLDNAAQVGTLTPGGPGATLIPFRPNQSPDPYMYIANGADYQKFSAPESNVVTASKVGIAEPQTGCEAAPVAQTFTEILSPGGTWNTGGTGSAWTSGDRSADIIVSSFNDPVNPIPEGGIHPSVPPRWSLETSPTVQYQRGEVLYLNGSPALITIIEEVIPPLAISMTIQAIYYNPGPLGRAVVALQGVTSPSKSQPVQNQSGSSLPPSETIAQLKRGAIVQVGTEKVYVESVTAGPTGQLCFEAVFGVLHAAGETVIGLPTIVINGVQNASSVLPATPIIGDQGNVETFTIGTGIGTLTTGPAGGGPTGTVISTPVVSLNGWGPNAHVGAYEMGIDQNFGWGLNPDTTYPYTDPTFVSDGDSNTFAWNPGFHSHKYWGCVWAFTSGTSQSGMVLNILSQALTNDEINTIPGHGTDVTPSGNKRSSGIWYSLDNSVTWNQIYNQGQNFGGARAKQWDSIPLPASQDITQVQVMAFSDAHDDQVQYVFEINITAGAASIGVDTGAFQDNDYLHFSVNVDNPANLAEMRLQFDVSDGTFLSNYYMTGVRPSDLVAATTASTPITLLAATQAIVSETNTYQGAGALNLTPSTPSVAGDGQWTEIWLPISALTRIGGDQTKTLANLNSVQVYVNATATVRVSISSIIFVGGSQPDIGDIGEPYRYRVRPRSKVTGAKGNPSPEMRYGVIAHRQPVQVNLPSAAYDTQIDTWDMFRFGGSVTSWRYIGSISSTKTSFQDDYSDEAAQAGDALEFDNLEPWPSIDFPLNATASTVVGTIAVVTIPSPTLVLRYLPGNLVNLGGQSTYTLRSRPTNISGDDYLFEFVECTAGFNQGAISDNGQTNIYEPAIARQFLPYMWGPDVNGTVFAVGDPLRPGTLYFSKGNNPDSAPDAFNQELVTPSEPLMGGLVLDGLSFVSSTERWWALYPQPTNPLQRYNPVQQPIPRGLAAPFGCCTDGSQIFFWAKDGIWSTGKGSLTDEDLYNLFPHDGVPGQSQTYGPPALAHTVLPPDYSRAGTFRLTYCNYYLYATYQDANGIYNTLVLDTRRNAWCVDLYGTQVCRFYHPEQQAGTLLTNSTRYPELQMADIQGRVSIQTPLSNDLDGGIQVLLATFEDPSGDLRAPKQWGDVFVDATCPAGMTINMMSQAVQVGPPLTVAVSPTRSRQPVSVGNAIITSAFMGLYFSWTDDFTTQTSQTILYIWQTTFVIQPAPTIQWQTLGTSFGMQGYGHIGQIAMAYISTADITLQITSYDGQSPLPIILPTSAGVYVKTLFRVSANKGQLYAFAASSTAPFQFFMEDCEIAVGPWARQDPYTVIKSFLSGPVDGAPL
jgi:hypothetical protein